MRREEKIVKRFLREADAVHSHRNLDVDAVSSMSIVHIVNPRIIPVGDIELNMKLSQISINIKKAETISSKVDIVVDTTLELSTSNAPKVLVIDHHLTRDVEEITPKDTSTVLELYIIRKPCLSNGLLLYRILLELGIFHNMDRKRQEMIRLLSMVSLMGDTNAGKYNHEVYTKMLDSILSGASRELEDQAKELYKKLSERLLNVSNLILGKRENRKVIGVLLEDFQETGPFANDMFNKHSKNIVIISKYKEYYKISIRLYTDHLNLDEVYRNLYTDLKSLANKVDLGSSNSQVYGGKIYTDERGDALLESLVSILERY